MRSWLICLLLVVLACGDDAGPATDAAIADASTQDAGTQDAGAPTTDAGLQDEDAAIPSDAGTLDAGTPDASLEDAGHDAGSRVDAGPQDAGVDAGRCTSPDTCTTEGATDCSEAALRQCTRDADDCLVWNTAEPCPGTEHGAGYCDTASSCALRCDDGYELCEGRCIPAGQRCGIALGGACETSADCGPSQSCQDNLCNCSGSTRVCASGCCEIAFETTDIEGIIGSDIRMAVAPSGVVYLAISRRRTGTTYDVHLYSWMPGDVALTVEPIVEEVVSGREGFDIAVRSDGVVFLAVARRGGARLLRWTPGDAMRTQVGFGSSEERVAVTVASDDTVWMAFATDSSFDASILRYPVGGPAESFVEGNLQYGRYVDIAEDRGEIYASWAHSFTGRRRAGLIAVDGAPERSGCDGDEMTFGSDGTSWSIHRYNHLTLCHNGRGRSARSLSTWFPTDSFSYDAAVDAEDTAQFIFFNADRTSVDWALSRDGERWTTRGLPMPADDARTFEVALAPDDRGEMLFAILPIREGSPLRLVRQP